MDVKTEYNSNQIRPSGFSRKPVRSVDWSLGSNDSAFSLHTRNASPSRELIGLAAALKFDEKQKPNGLVKKITETTPVISLPPDKESQDTKKSDNVESDDNEDEGIIKVNCEELEVSDVTEKQDEIEDDGGFAKEIESVEENLIPLPPQVKESQQDSEESDSESDDEDNTEETKHVTETDLVPLLPSLDESQDIEKSGSESDGEDDYDDVKEIIADDSSICCRSDRSNNSISSFTFPILHKEDGCIKTPSFETSWNVFDKRWKPWQEKTQPQRRFYFISATHTLTHLPSPPRNWSKKLHFQMRPRKAFRNCWFSCFYGPLQHE